MQLSQVILEEGPHEVLDGEGLPHPVSREGGRGEGGGGGGRAREKERSRIMIMLTYSHLERKRGRSTADTGTCAEILMRQSTVWLLST